MIEAAKRSFYFFMESLLKLCDNSYSKAPDTGRLSFEIVGPVTKMGMRVGWEIIRFPAGELASLLGRFTPCGVSPRSFSRGSLTISPPTQL
ncbi:hypothetical protein CEH05_04545 [Halobacillus halophilus]|nr:hypothetical protein CEH05_04545 [Halobacillus halophilus]